jgi:alpha-L-fucosidase
MNSFPFFALLLSGLALNAADTQSGGLPSTPRPYPERLEWWAQARFGLFIHWGPVSLTGTEISWSRANTNPKCPNHGDIPAEVYDNLYQQFNPTNFDASRWVGAAKAGGAKYVVLTAKHCDGFLLWHSLASDYNIGATPFGRDVCAELSAAARKKGMRVGWYFSPMDWRDPDFRTARNATFLVRMQTELRELLGNYGPIDLLWFDYDGCEPLYDQARTYGIAKGLQPRIVIDNRLDLGRDDANTRILSTNADYYTPEQQVGAYDDQQPWESCMTLSSRNQWAWGGTNDGVKTLEDCLNMLISCAGGDGNLLLNVGPRPDGEIAPEQANRLREIGAWLAHYGESIHGTRGGPFKPGDYGASTRRGSTIYLHIRDWEDSSLKLPPLPVKVLRHRVLTGGRAVIRQTADGLEISVSEEGRQPIDTIVALEIDGDATRLSAMDVPGPVSLTTGAKATASNVYQNLAEYGADKAVDGKRDTRWATDSGIKSAWLEVDLGRPSAVSRAVVRQAFPELGRIRKFAIEYLKDGQWLPCCQGGNPGAKLSVTFAPITAQHVRLNITDSTDGPTIWEFQLF